MGNKIEVMLGNNLQVMTTTIEALIDNVKKNPCYSECSVAFSQFVSRLNTDWQFFIYGAEINIRVRLVKYDN